MLAELIRLFLSPPSTRLPDSAPTLSDIACSEGQLVEEYKLLQGKLDKIGEFKFHVKNWAFTLTLGILVGGFASKLPILSVFFSAVVPSAAFWLLDRRQDRLSDTYAKRAIYLEEVARRNLKAKDASLGAGLPAHSIQSFGIAQAILHSNRRRKRPRIRTDNWVYLLLVVLCGIACFGASKRDKDKTQQVAGRLSVELSTPSPTSSPLTTNVASPVSSSSAGPALPAATPVQVAPADASWLWTLDPETVRQKTSLPSPSLAPATNP